MTARTRSCLTLAAVGLALVAATLATTAVAAGSRGDWDGQPTVHLDIDHSPRTSP